MICHHLEDDDAAPASNRSYSYSSSSSPSFRAITACVTAADPFVQLFVPAATAMEDEILRPNGPANVAAAAASASSSSFLLLPLLLLLQPWT